MGHIVGVPGGRWSRSGCSREAAEANNDALNRGFPEADAGMRVAHRVWAVATTIPSHRGNSLAMVII